MKRLALGAIAFYQRYVSPLKGFSCAYRACTGCSTLGLRAIRRYGVWKGCGVLRRRLARCGIAYRRYVIPARHAQQHGFCDCDIPCELDCLGGVLDSVSCPFDCGWFGRKDKDKDKDVHIPV